MDDELKFSLSDELLTQEAEIRKCDLNQGGMGYIQVLTRASAILSFWHDLALRGHPYGTGDERVKADWQRLHAIIYKKSG